MSRAEGAATPVADRIFVNLPVRDLGRSTAFFSALGFTFDDFFTDENAAAMNIGPNMHAMLLTEEFFRGFAPRGVAPRSAGHEVHTCLSVGTRARVDALVAAAVAAGGQESGATLDYGWMYQRSFEDPDGHAWGLLAVDDEALAKLRTEGCGP
jgi:predicted lactoylglutathione lyase